MSTPESPLIRRMKLRYPGTCRLCARRLDAGTFALYETPQRTVRCITCDVGVELPADTAVDAAPTMEHAASPSGELRLRAPASAVIVETIRAQAGTPPRSTAARVFGRSPLGAESLPWYLGAIGELEVGRILDQLGPGWSAIHAIPVGRSGSDIDHLVIGPGGVFTINSKFHDGKNVWVGARRLLVNGQRTDHLRNAAFEGRRVAKLLSSSTSGPVAVTPIVAIVGSRRITVRERPADVVVLSARELARWLHRRPVALSEEQVAKLTRIAFDASTWGNPDLPAPDLIAFAELREIVGTARTRRQLWALLVLLSPLAVSAAMFLTLLR